jgi:hypothetical protein
MARENDLSPDSIESSQLHAPLSVVRTPETRLRSQDTGRVLPTAGSYNGLRNTTIIGRFCPEGLPTGQSLVAVGAQTNQRRRQAACLFRDNPCDDSHGCHGSIPRATISYIISPFMNTWMSRVPYVALSATCDLIHAEDETARHLDADRDRDDAGVKGCDSLQ